MKNSIGVSRQAVNAIETGKFIPSTILALKMATVFETKVESIFQLEEIELANTSLSDQ